ncbi:MAG: fasciclin domain-containing protein [Erythrobacter sp.]
MSVTPKLTFKAAALAVLAATTTLGAAPAFADNHNSEAAAGTIVETAVGTGVHNTLVAAVQAAGLVEMLSSPGPFTIFAPTDEAFAKLPEGTVETLVQPENKQMLVGILAYHAVAGEVTSGDLVKLITENGGTASFNTITGAPLTATIEGENVVITDAKGGKAMVTMADVKTTNGVIHVTDGVFLPA